MICRRPEPGGISTLLLEMAAERSAATRLTSVAGREISSAARQAPVNGLETGAKGGERR